MIVNLMMNIDDQARVNVFSPFSVCQLPLTMALTLQIAWRNSCYVCFSFHVCFDRQMLRGRHVRVRVRVRVRCALFTVACVLMLTMCVVGGARAHGDDDDDDGPEVTVILPPLDFDHNVGVLWPRAATVTAPGVVAASTNAVAAAAADSFDFSSGAPLTTVAGGGVVVGGGITSAGAKRGGGVNVTVPLHTLQRVSMLRGSVVVTRTPLSPTEPNAVSSSSQSGKGAYTLTVALRPLNSALTGAYLAVGGVKIDAIDSVDDTADSNARSVCT
jgi:hypothetical protein